MSKLFIVCSITKIKVYLIHLTLYGYLVHSPDGPFSLVLSATFTSTKLMILHFSDSCSGIWSRSEKKKKKPKVVEESRRPCVLVLLTFLLHLLPSFFVHCSHTGHLAVLSTYRILDCLRDLGLPESRPLVPSKLCEGVLHYHWSLPSNIASGCGGKQRVWWWLGGQKAARVLVPAVSVPKLSIILQSHLRMGFLC